MLVGGKWEGVWAEIALVRRSGADGLRRLAGDGERERANQVGESDLFRQPYLLFCAARWGLASRFGLLIKP